MVMQKHNTIKSKKKKIKVKLSAQSKCSMLTTMTVATRMVVLTIQKKFSSINGTFWGKVITLHCDTFKIFGVGLEFPSP